MNRETDSEVIKRTFWLLRRIKRFFQTFRFREDDLSMVNDWAEVLGPVIDWTPAGLTLYVQEGNTKEPSAADIYNYADRARIKAGAASSQNTPPEYAIQDQSEESKKKVDEYIARKNDELGITRKRSEAARRRDKAENRQRQLEAARHHAKQDLPFVPDEEELPK